MLPWGSAGPTKIGFLGLSFSGSGGANFFGTPVAAFFFGGDLALSPSDKSVAALLGVLAAAFFCGGALCSGPVASPLLFPSPIPGALEGGGADGGGGGALAAGGAAGGGGGAAAAGGAAGGGGGAEGGAPAYIGGAATPWGRCLAGVDACPARWAGGGLGSDLGRIPSGGSL